MRIFRFQEAGQLHWGVQRDGELYRADKLDLSNLGNLPLGENLDSARLHFVAPVAPGKIIAVGRNYAAHARELGNKPPTEPLLFLKAPSSLLDPEGRIELPAISQHVDFEGELALVIGSRARHVSASHWRSYVLGFTCANDVTARDLQKRDVQFARAKSFDTFCPLGPWIETDLDASELALTTRVNGAVRQQASTADMIFPPGVLLEFISRVMTLEPGDVILTGTPEGVGPLQAGDTVEVEIERIGTLRNHVVHESAS
jgi:2-keto-4-pentenoate hydratase/2-oxohepta-3-ene-1,7-dioic acid hydratase in catechol pathway